MISKSSLRCVAWVTLSAMLYAAVVMGDPKPCSLYSSKVLETCRVMSPWQRPEDLPDAGYPAEAAWIRGLLFGQGVHNYNPLHKNRRECLEELRTGDGHSLPAHLKAEILREIDRLELVLRQISEVETERDEMLQPAQASSPVALLMRLKGIGAEFATVLYLEGLFRHFANRRQLAAYAGLAPSPWKSGSIDHEQGISKTGNPRLRTTMVELAWMWVRYQPGSGREGRPGEQ